MRLLICLLAGAALGSTACAGSTRPDLASVLAAQEARLLDGARSARIVVLKGDERLAEVSFGEVAGGARPDARTLYTVGSVSKLLTATAVMQQVAEGTVDLDAPLIRYLPELRIRPVPGDPDDQAASITVRQVLHHHAGFPSDHYHRLVGPGRYDFHEYLQALAGEHLVSRPGEITTYSNIGYTLLGLVVERAAGRPFAEYMQDAVLGPAGMSDSGFALGGEARARLAPLPDDAALLDLAVIPAGGLWATADDVARFGRAFLDGALSTVPQRAKAQRAEAQRAEAQRAKAQRAEGQITEAQIAKAQRAEAQRAEGQITEAQIAEGQIAAPQLAEAQIAEAQRAEAQRAEMWRVQTELPIDGGFRQGLGWYRFDAPLDVGEVWGHNGATLQARATLLVAPEHDLVVAVVAAGVVDTSAAAMRVLAAAAGKPFREPAVAPVDAAGLAGRWQAGDFGSLVLEADSDGVLSAEFGGYTVELAEVEEGGYEPSVLLLGLVSYQPGIFKGQRYTFARIAGEDVLINLRGGSAVTGGFRVRSAPVSEPWRARVGKWSIQNEDDPLYEGFELLVASDGALILRAGFGEAGHLDYALEIADDRHARVAGRGRDLGMVVRAEDDGSMMFSGYRLERE